MKRMTACVLCLMLMLACGVSMGETGAALKLEPLPVEEADFANGTFEVAVSEENFPDPGSELVLNLFQADLYAADGVENLKPGDTVTSNGRDYPVELVVIHGLYDEDGDGEYDGSDVTVRDAEQVQELLDMYGIRLSEYELVPEEYEIYSENLDGSYLVFRKAREGLYQACMDDWVPVHFLKSVSVPLPLPESFVYWAYPGGDDPEKGSAEEFLESLRTGSPEYFSQYNTQAVFRDGMLMEIHSWSYPWGPEEP